MPYPQYKQIMCGGEACRPTDLVGDFDPTMTVSTLGYYEGYFLDAVKKNGWMMTRINGQDQPVCPKCKQYYKEI